MTTLDFSPLFRSMIGFDRLIDSLETAYRTEPGGYPPYNVEVQDENSYRITLAVAGFTDSELDIEAKENMLTVSGQRKATEAEGNFLYRGIANRGFERKFQLADYVKVVDASLENGLLHIDLVREVPDMMKPRRIEIRGGEQGPAIEDASDRQEAAKAA
ncbi:heat shock protein Hsp20 [Thiorhodococcus drewsii AZ1]|uniref:Heat shock protein Hsp20 n=1 Tax=Thiorhodococcus drewsii AZ1 TaxID=765913 RepID=G2E229_9GAMM|nr:Hsp20 family protein [Thiorhodococcus drewsii]EGV30978.1 heat shock protein Hsp20 [Thiorhodococcus drewsii AZ1]